MRRAGRRHGIACWLAAVLIAASAIGGCATVDPWQDARIEAEVKARLVAERDADLTRLGVQSRQTVVYLTGRVRSAEERAMAESLSRGVSGVTRVENALEVQPEPK